MNKNTQLGMIIDLRPNGLGWEIDTEKELYIPEDPEDMIVKMTVQHGNEATFVPFLENNPQTFYFGEELGHGSYGKTYTIDGLTDRGNTLVCKILDRKHSSLKATIREFLIQLIIVYDTADIQQDTNFPEGILDAIEDGTISGPFVPNVSLFAIDKNSIYIVSEAMDTTVEKVIGAGPGAGPPPAGIMVDIITQLSGMLYILHKKEHFNHRDLKSDNIMMKQNKVRLIDFGFSCLDHELLKVNASNGTRFTECDKRDRDMSSFFFELLLFNYKDPKIPLGQIMRLLLGAMPDKWSTQYKFYNRSVNNELMTAKFIFDLFKNAKIVNPKDPYSKIDLEIGLNLPSYGEGNTLLHKAAENSDIGLIKRLLQIPGAKTKTLNNAGLTAYHVAALTNANKEIFDVLIKHNPSLASKKTPEGKTADELVNNDELRKYLVSKKALIPALVRNTNKSLWGGTRKDLKRRRRTTRRR